MKIKYIAEDIKSSPEEVFTGIANQLLKEYRLVIREQEFILTEIEFYCFSESLNHMDTCCYRRGQKKYQELHPESWFKHASGLDITLDSGTDVYLGVLIRAMCEIKDGKASEKVYGPLKCRDIIEPITKSEFKSGFSDNCYDSKTSYYLKYDPYHTEGNQEVFQCRRHGLSNKENYSTSLYRFFTFPKARHDKKEMEILPCIFENYKGLKETLPEKFGRSQQSFMKIVVNN